MKTGRKCVADLSPSEHTEQVRKLARCMLTGERTTRGPRGSARRKDAVWSWARVRTWLWKRKALVT